MIAGQGAFEVELPVGFVDATGHRQRGAALRKMRGVEEELLYDQGLDPGRLISQLLGSCLVHLGDAREVTADDVAGLTCADRDYLLLELRRITLGDGLRSRYVCRACEARIAVDDDLSALPVRRLAGAPEPIEVTLDDGYTAADGAVHRDVTLRLPTGADEAFVARVAERDPLRARDALLLRCIERFGDVRRAQLEAFGIKILRELTLGDRRRLHRAFTRESPGVDFARTIECGACGACFETILDASDFFGGGWVEPRA